MGLLLLHGSAARRYAVRGRKGGESSGAMTGGDHGAASMRGISLLEHFDAAYFVDDKGAAFVPYGYVAFLFFVIETPVAHHTGA